VKIPVRRRFYMGLDRMDSQYVNRKYYIIGALSGSISSNTGKFIRKLINKLPNSWYIDHNYKIIQPVYSRSFTKIKSKLRKLSYYLDGTDNKVIKKYEKQERW